MVCETKEKKTSYTTELTRRSALESADYVMGKKYISFLFILHAFISLKLSFSSSLETNPRVSFSLFTEADFFLFVVFSCMLC